MVELVGAEDARREISMTGIRFIRKDGQSVDTAIIRKRFFESALDCGSSLEGASRIWNHAMFGDPYARTGDRKAMRNRNCRC